MARSRSRALVLELVADQKSFKKGADSWTKQVAKLGAGLGVAFGAREFVGFLGDSISAASDLEESLNAVGKVFGRDQEVIAEYANAAAESVGLSARAYNELATSTGALLKNSGLDDYTDLTIELTDRASDMASVFNTEVSEAMAAIQSGLRGQSQPLTQYGVDVRKTAVQAHALAMGLAATTAELTEQDIQLAKIDLIMVQTSDTAGDFRDTSDGLANSQRILKANLENVSAELGESLLPLMADLSVMANDLLTSTGGPRGLWGQFNIGLQELQKPGAQVVDLLTDIFTLGQNDFDLSGSITQTQDMQKALNLMYSDLRGGMDPLEASALALLRMGANAELSADRYDEMTDQMGLTATELREVTRLAVLNASKFDLSKRSTTTLYQELDKLDDRFGDLTAVQSDSRDEMALWAKVTGDAVEESDNLTESLTPHEQLVRDNTAAMWELRSDRFDIYLYNLKQAWDELAGATGWAADELDNWSDTRDAIYRSVGGGGQPWVPDPGGTSTQTIVNVSGIIGDPISTGAQINSAIGRAAAVRGV